MFYFNKLLFFIFPFFHEIINYNNMLQGFEAQKFYFF